MLISYIYKKIPKDGKVEKKKGGIFQYFFFNITEYTGHQQVIFLKVELNKEYRNNSYKFQYQLTNSFIFEIYDYAPILISKNKSIIDDKVVFYFRIEDCKGFKFILFKFYADEDIVMISNTEKDEFEPISKPIMVLIVLFFVIIINALIFVLSYFCTKNNRDIIENIELLDDKKGELENKSKIY